MNIQCLDASNPQASNYFAADVIEGCAINTAAADARLIDMTMKSSQRMR